MVWETLADAVASDASQFGGQYLNRISQLMTGTDIATTDATLKPLIGTDWRFKSGRLFIQDSGNNNTVQVISDDQTVNTIVKIPIQTQSTDYISLRNQTETLTHKTIDATQNTILNLSGAWNPNGVETLTNKTINAPNNTITNIADTNVSATAAIAKTKLAALNIGDSDISSHTSTKITITNKAQLPATAVYTGDTQTLTAKTMDYNANTFQNFPSGGGSTSPMNWALTRRAWGYGVADPTALVWGGMIDRVTTTVGSSGTNTGGTDNTVGVYWQTGTGTTTSQRAGGTPGGTTINYIEPDWNPYIEAKIKLPTTIHQFAVGLTSQSGLATSDTILASTDIGILVGVRSTDSTFQIFTNNGTGAMTVTNIPTVNPKDGNWHLITMKTVFGSSFVTVSIDGNTPVNSSTTRFPTTTQKMAFMSMIGNGSAAVNDILTHRAYWIEWDQN